MSYIMNALAGITGLYMFLICIRILLTWFPGAHFGRVFDFLCGICDPYLDWFRRFRIFKNSPLDFSPLLALAVLSLVNRIFITWGAWGRISVGLVLALILDSVWSVFSWVLGFFIIILILRLVAYIVRANIYSPFWRFVDFIAQPLMYRVSRVFFPNRIISYTARLVISIIILVAVSALSWGIISFGTAMLSRLPF